jgi:tape measure domain-containing protein
MAAELRLNVSLDLGFFRQQLQKLTVVAQSEFTPKLNVKFNRSTLDKELNNLQSAIKRRVYRIEIGGNIDSLPDKIKTLKDQLASLQDTKIDVGVGAVKSLSPRDARGIKADLRTTILDGAKKILVPVTVTPSIIGKDVTNFKRVAKEQLSGIFVGASIKPSILKQDVTDFTNAVRSKLSGITVSVKAELETASIRGGAKSRSDIEADVLRGLERISEIGATRMSGGGGVTESARREQLKQRLSTGEFDIGQLRALSEQLGVKGGGRFKNTQSLIERIVAEASIEMIKKYLDPQAVMRNPDRSMLGKVLDTFARGVFNMLGMDPASIRAQQQASKPKPFTPAGLLPAAYRGIGPSAEPAGLLPPAYRGIGPSAEPAGLLPSLSSAGQSKAIIEALIASTGPRLLPSGGGDDTLGKLAAPRQTKDAVDAILRNYFKVVEAQVKEVFSVPPIKKESLNIFDYLDMGQYLNYLAQARINTENAIKKSIEDAKQVTKQNQIKDAAQSFLRALEETVRNAERSAFVQSRIAANKSYVQKANIREIGQPLLEGRQVAAPKMLSAATGFYRGASTSPLPETQAQLFARREREARMRSAFRGLSVSSERGLELPGTTFMGDDFTRGGGRDRVTGSGQPPQRGGALALKTTGAQTPLSPDYYKNAIKYSEALKIADASTRNFSGSQIPLIGGIKNLAGEFGEAAKQVLLYGTAYKGLAFLTSLPGQILNAAKSQQQFANGLKTATQDTGTFAKELLYVDNVQRAFGLNLETTRTGFTRLYASMAPTGFDSGSIEKLFTGISAATASLQLTPDKAERVIYAFGQMASKGQIMSEELKGQLGDVLPGALAIFSKAAGMSVKEFSKAMEDGEFVGNRFREVFAKVSDELMNRFGTGAQAAGRSLQGLINTVGGDFQRVLESFSPLANSAAQAILGPLGGSLKQLALSAQIATGEIERVFMQLKE